MRSYDVAANQGAYVPQYNNLRADARASSFLLAQQMVGYFTLSTNPANGKTITLTVNGSAIICTFVSAIGTTAGNVLIGATAAATVANLLALLRQPQTTTSTGIALTSVDWQLLSYLSFAASSSTLYVLSNNNSLYAPLTSFSGSTNATSDSYTAQAMQLYVHSGTVYVGGTRVLFAGGSTPTVTAPTSHPRIDVLSIDNTGTLAWTTGTESATPSAPTYPANKVAICELYNVVGETGLNDNENQQSGQGYIYNDVRPTVGGSVDLSALTASLLPSSDGGFDLGSLTFQWGTIYAKNGIFLNGVSINSLITSGFTAGETLAAGNAVAIQPYPTNLPAYDNSASGSGSFSSSAPETISFTVGNNANRVLVVITDNDGGSFGPTNVGPVTYNGVSMTEQSWSGNGEWGSTTSARAQAFILQNPSIGANNLVINFANSLSRTNRYWIYSFYNVSTFAVLSSDSHNSLSPSAITLSNLTASNAAIVFGFVHGTSIGGTALTNNVLSQGSGNQAGWVGPIAPIAAQTISSASAGDAAILIAFYPDYSGASGRAYKASSMSTPQATGYVGIAQSAATVGNSVTVATNGIDNNQSGLTTATEYYINDTPGSIGTTAGTVTRKAGVAVDSTKLLITNIW